jgi:hypothetical protein
MEHDRWAADRYLDGWTYAPERDNRRKHHPQLIPYADLSEPMKDLDRFAVRLIPTLLARSGRGVVRMLLVGVRGPGEESASETSGNGDGGSLPADRERARRGLQRLVDETLQRLVQRYPDRSLVLASTLASAQARLVVGRAIDHFESGLFLLCPRPLSDTLAAQPDEGSRRELLRLVASAERRIGLSGGAELERWLAERTEIDLLLGAAPAVGTTRKQVGVDSATGGPRWNFEY